MAKVRAAPAPCSRTPRAARSRRRPRLGPFALRLPGQPLHRPDDAIGVAAGQPHHLVRRDHLHPAVAHAHRRHMAQIKITPLQLDDIHDALSRTPSERPVDGPASPLSAPMRTAPRKYTNFHISGRPLSSEVAADSAAGAPAGFCPGATAPAVPSVPRLTSRAPALAVASAGAREIRPKLSPL